MSVRDDAKAFARGTVFLGDGGLLTVVWSPKVYTWSGAFTDETVDVLRAVIEGTYLHARRKRAKRKR